MSQGQATAIGFGAFFGFLAVGEIVREGFGIGVATSVGLAVYFFLRGFQKGGQR